MLHGRFRHALEKQATCMPMTTDMTSTMRHRKMPALMLVITDGQRICTKPALGEGSIPRKLHQGQGMHVLRQ